MAQQSILDFEQLRIGDRVRGLACIWSCRAQRTRNDSPFLQLELRDSSKTILPAVMWDADPEIAPECPVVAEISGDVGEFRGNLQIRVQQFRITDDDVGLFLPTTYRPVSELEDELTGIIGLIGDDLVRELVESCLERSPGFWTAPAAVGFHGAYRSGLLEHTLHVARVCLQAADIYAGRVNQDLLLASAVLHDIGKHDAYDSPEGRNPVEDERLVGHITRGAMLIEQTAREIEYSGHIPLADLLHAIISHHGERQFGAPVEPATAEALILSAADRLDADVTGLFDLWRDQPASDNWTYSRQRQGWTRRPDEPAEITRHPLDDLPY